MSIQPISNLPPVKSKDSSDAGRVYFNTYYQTSYNVSSDVLNTSVAFFTSRGFDQTAAESIATVLISQAKIQNVNVLKFIDTLKTLNGVQLSNVVKQILNNNRLRISTLGTRFHNVDNINFELRNVLP